MTIKDIAKEFIRLCLSSTAAYAVFPLQDVLEYGSEGRMNTPGLASGNWGWRYLADELTDDIAEELKTLTILFGRHEEPVVDEETTNTEDTSVDTVVVDDTAVTNELIAEKEVKVND